MLRFLSTSNKQKATTVRVVLFLLRYYSPITDEFKPEDTVYTQTLSIYQFAKESLLTFIALRVMNFSRFAEMTAIRWNCSFDTKSKGDIKRAVEVRWCDTRWRKIVVFGDHFIIPCPTVNDHRLDDNYDNVFKVKLNLCNVWIPKNNRTMSNITQRLLHRFPKNFNYLFSENRCRL